MSRIENPRELLATCPLFSSLDYAAIGRICMRYHIGIKHHDRRSVVMLRGEVYDQLLFVARGIIAYDAHTVTVLDEVALDALRIDAT